MFDLFEMGLFIFRAWQINPEFWSYEVLSLYEVMSFYFFAQSCIGPGLEWYYTGDFGAFETVEVYLCAANFFFASGVFTLYWLTKKTYGVLTREEIRSIVRNLIPFLGDTCIIIGSSLEVWIERDCNLKFICTVTSIIIFHALLSLAHFIGMIKCTSMAINMDSPVNQGTLKSLVNNWMFTLLIVDLYFVFASMTWIWNFRDMFYLQFLHRFISLALDSIYTRVWYALKLKKWKASRGSSYSAKEFDDEFLDAKSTCVAAKAGFRIVSCINGPSISSLFDVFTSVVDGFVTMVSTREDSLLSYDISLALHAAKKSELTSNNNKCTICTELMSFQDFKTESSDSIIPVKLSCEHMFHYGCLLGLVDDKDKKNECPVCKASLDEENSRASSAAASKETPKVKDKKRNKKVDGRGDGDSSTDSVISNVSYLAPGSKSEQNGRL